jgi:hypothetical protein
MGYDFKVVAADILVPVADAWLEAVCHGELTPLQFFYTTGWQHVSR